MPFYLVRRASTTGTPTMYTSWMPDKRYYRSLSAAKKRAKELEASAPETVEILMYRDKTMRDAGLSVTVWRSKASNLRRE